MGPDEERVTADIDRLFEEGDEIDRACDRSVREALLKHKQAGNPIAIWRDGKVVWIPPEEILVEPPTSSKT